METFFTTVPNEFLQCVFDAPGVLEDNLFTSLLQARYQGVPEEVLLQRLQLLQRLLGEQEWTKNLLYTYKGDVAYELIEVRKSIRKVKKYSGYARTPSAVGSKRSSGTRPEPEMIEWKPFIEEFDFLSFLTVGKFTEGFLSKVILSPEDEPKSSKRSNSKDKPRQK